MKIRVDLTRDLDTAAPPVFQARVRLFARDILEGLHTCNNVVCPWCGQPCATYGTHQITSGDLHKDTCPFGRAFLRVGLAEEVPE